MGRLEGCFSHFSFLASSSSAQALVSVPVWLKEDAKRGVVGAEPMTGLVMTQALVAVVFVSLIS